MVFLTRLTLLAGGAWILGLVAIVMLQIANGRIAVAGLLTTKDDQSRQTFSPARLQLLIFTVVVAARYLYQVFVHLGQDALPPLPPGVVAALGGSQAVYLAGKAFATYVQPLLKHLE